MLKPITTKQFEKDVKLAIKRGKKTTKLREVMTMLLKQEKLPIKYRDHSLTGNYVNRRECHVEPDWLLIYKLENEFIIFERTGTHSDLFK
ncbi:type II toxin-antitoxin system YafQ family toxin (plasmid) [Legionella sp. D16C41]|uniref:type II toxin-antitoxin system YafQ family toxin n=1 Tax=Legionella sp. D16C41 TaxID=3402688 RepID=UPI003AF52D0D